MSPPQASGPSRVARDDAVRLLAGGTPTVLVEVIEAHGSVPRGVGTRMLVTAHRTIGTIGGGHLELEAIVRARRRLAGPGDDGDGDDARVRFPLGPALGQCCGGAVTLRIARLDADALAAWPATEPLFRLQLHGAGHVGRAVATLLATLDCAVDWFDQRDDGFPEATTLGSPWPAHVRRTAIDTVEAEVAHARPGDLYLVLTHEHALDLRIVEAILRRGDAGYVGLIGSETKRAAFTRRLQARGVTDASIATLVCPIGVPGVAGKEPAVIAAAVVAQLLQAAAPARAPRVRSEAAESAVDEQIDAGHVRGRAG